MHEGEFMGEMTIEHARADVLTSLHTVVYDTLHAQPQNSVHSREVGGYLDEIIKLIEEKVVIVDAVEEINLKNGTLAVSIYSDRTHTYMPRWLDWGKIVGEGTHQSGQICCLRMQTAKSAVKSGLSKHYLARR